MAAPIKARWFGLVLLLTFCVAALGAESPAAFVLAASNAGDGSIRFAHLRQPADAGGYVRTSSPATRPPSSAILAATARSLAPNWPIFTTELRFTDRVLSRPHASSAN